MDLSQVLSGPYCTQILGDLGAEVIKVEPPGGDGTRKWGPPFLKGESAYFLSVNRNKKSIVVDLKKGKIAREIIRKIAKDVDVFVENFRPGVVRELGVSYRTIRKLNPKIVYCSISGYGQTGPLSQKPGYDIAAYAASGIMSITGVQGSAPVKTGVPVADLGAGMFAALAISACLFDREGTGKGSYIDISLYDSMISWLTFQAGIYFATRRNPVPLGSAHPIIAPYQAFKAKDRFFVLAVGNDNLWVKACSAMNLPKLIHDPRFSTNSKRINRRKQLAMILEKVLSKRTAKFWLGKFEQAGVPCSPINTVGEALNSEHTAARSLIIRLKHRKAGYIGTIASPMKISATFSGTQSSPQPPPMLGEHTQSVLGDFGYRKEEITRLFEEKVVR